MAFRIAVVPLDDRPVNLSFLPLLAATGGVEVSLPPRDLLGRFLQPGDPEAVLAWLAATLADVDAVVVSLDMLAYGGLVASRTPVVAHDLALKRLAVLREVLAQHPGVVALAFSVIMRLTITGADAATRAAGRDIFTYSILRDRVERLGEAGAAAELAQVTGHIPPAILAAYLQARARNHAINLAALDLAADGVLAYVALVQEDTAPVGLHFSEQAALVARAQGRVAPECWALYAGTDEAAQTLLARAALRADGLPFPVAARFRAEAAARHPARFEDVALIETVRRQIGAVGGTWDPGGLPVGIHTFSPPQADLFDWAGLEHPTWEAALAHFPPPENRDWWMQAPPAIAVADVAYCNGGDPHLLASLCAHGHLPALWGYAGWNTAGNTLGTTLAMTALRLVGEARGDTPAMTQAARRALLVRVLDDALYQPIVRGWVAAQVEESGLSPLNLADATPRVSAQVNACLQTLWHDLTLRYPVLGVLDEPFVADLPWGRLFEVDIRVPPTR
jgi:hypothetical protein